MAWYDVYLIKQAVGASPKSLGNMLGQAIRSTHRFTRSGDPGRLYEAGVRTSQKYLAPILEREVAHAPAWWAANPAAAQTAVAPMMEAMTPKLFSHAKNLARKLQKQKPDISVQEMSQAFLPEMNKLHRGTAGDLAEAQRRFRKLEDTAERMKLLPPKAEDPYNTFGPQRDKLTDDLSGEFNKPYER